MLKRAGRFLYSFSENCHWVLRRLSKFPGLSLLIWMPSGPLERINTKFCVRNTMKTWSKRYSAIAAGIAVRRSEKAVRIVIDPKREFCYFNSLIPGKKVNNLLAMWASCLFLSGHWCISMSTIFSLCNIPASKQVIKSQEWMKVLFLSSFIRKSLLSHPFSSSLHCVSSLLSLSPLLERVE